MKKLVEAILAVMKDVENIDKNMNVGTGTNAYKGVQDKDVKMVIGKAMQKHGLVILPIRVEPTTKIDRWEEDTYYNGAKSGVKAKQSVFTEVKTTYLLIHSSGESMEIQGYGHGSDPLDKSAGKATTYALKNALLYMFLVPTGAIDDTDTTHSDDAQVPQKGQEKPVSEKAETKIIGLAPGLPKVVNEAKDLETLNTIWNNNKKLHENVDFLKIVADKRIDFAITVEELTKIFNSSPLLHTDKDFVNKLTKAKESLKKSNTTQKTA